VASALHSRAQVEGECTGTVAFPGGRLETGRNPRQQAALREANEEVGRDGTRGMLGHLDDFITSSWYQ